MQSESNGSMDMTHGPLLGKIIIFTLPIIASSVLQLLFNAADVIVVGKFAGDDSLAAVGSTTSLIHLMTNLFIGMQVGVNVCAAQKYGARHFDDVNDTLQTSYTFSIICGVALIFVGVFGADPMLQLMGSPDDVIGLASQYVRIYFLAMPAIVMYNFLAGTLRAVGDTTHPLMFLSIAGVVNVILNLILVIVFKMDVAGVAIATVVSNYMSCLLMVGFLYKKRDYMKLDPKKFIINPKILKKIIRVGLPAGLQGTVFSISNVVIQSAVNSFGTIVMAGSAAAASIEDFVYVSMNSVYQSAVTFVGQNYGAGDPKRVRKVMWQCLAIVIVVGEGMGFLVYFLGAPLLSIYTNSAASIAAGLVRLKWICLPYALCGIMEVLTAGQRGMGHSTVPMIVSLLGACCSRLVWISTYFKAHPTQGVLYFSYPGSWLLTLSVHAICFAVTYSHWKMRLDEQQIMKLG